MRSSPSLFAIALLLALPLDLGAAQDTAPSPAAGARIRVRALHTYIGTLVAIDTATLVLRRDAYGDTVLVPVGSISRLDMSTGRKSGAGRGARTGAIVGATAGALLGLAAVAEGCPPNSFICFGPEVIPAAALGGALWGAGLGALIGLANPIDQWTQAPVRALEVGIVPLPERRLGIGLSIGF